MCTLGTLAICFLKPTFPEELQIHCFCCLATIFYKNLLVWLSVRHLCVFVLKYSHNTKALRIVIYLIKMTKQIILYYILFTCSTEHQLNEQFHTYNLLCYILNCQNIVKISGLRQKCQRWGIQCQEICTQCHDIRWHYLFLF